MDVDEALWESELYERQIKFDLKKQEYEDELVYITTSLIQFCKDLKFHWPNLKISLGFERSSDFFILKIQDAPEWSKDYKQELMDIYRGINNNLLIIDDKLNEIHLGDDFKELWNSEEKEED